MKGRRMDKFVRNWERSYFQRGENNVCPKCYDIQSTINRMSMNFVINRSTNIYVHKMPKLICTLCDDPIPFSACKIRSSICEQIVKLKIEGAMTERILVPFSSEANAENKCTVAQQLESANSKIYEQLQRKSKLQAEARMTHGRDKGANKIMRAESIVGTKPPGTRGRGRAKATKGRTVIRKGIKKSRGKQIKKNGLNEVATGDIDEFLEGGVQDIIENLFREGELETGACVQKLLDDTSLYINDTSGTKESTPEREIKGTGEVIKNKKKENQENPENKRVLCDYDETQKNQEVHKDTPTETGKGNKLWHEVTQTNVGKRKLADEEGKELTIKKGKTMPESTEKVIVQKLPDVSNGTFAAQEIRHSVIRGQSYEAAKGGGYGGVTNAPSTSCWCGYQSNTYQNNGINQAHTQGAYDNTYRLPTNVLTQADTALNYYTNSYY